MRRRVLFIVVLPNPKHPIQFAFDGVVEALVAGDELLNQFLRQGQVSRLVGAAPKAARQGQAITPIQRQQLDPQGRDGGTGETPS
jgi:hypothetical protein